MSSSPQLRSVSDVAPSAAAAAIHTDGYEAGDKLSDRYVLVRPLGAGGMGVVWLAHSVNLDVYVAIKLLHGSLAGTMAVDRMAREARAAAKLRHNSMVRVFDFGQSRRGHPYIVMEFLHGESLSDVLRRKGRLDAVRAVRTLLPIADALATAHDKGIVHRDVKPGNVFIAHDDQNRVQPKLLDFGVAKLDEENLAKENRKLTEVGAVLGSPDYLSPEQATGQGDIDARTDIWAFSVMLYEAITERPPFAADNYNALLYAIATEEPVPIRNFLAGDDALWEILKKGLAKSRDERWQSMWEMGEALARWLLEREVQDDICSNSLRSSWTEARRVGASAPPGPDVQALKQLQPTTARSSLIEVTQHEPVTASLAQPRSYLRSRPLLAVALGAALLLLVALAFSGRLGGSDEAKAASGVAAPAEAHPKKESAPSPEPQAHPSPSEKAQPRGIPVTSLPREVASVAPPPKPKPQPRRHVVPRKKPRDFGF